MANDGSLVTVVADLVSWKVVWKIDGIKAAEELIPEVMRINKFYFYITMYTRNNQVEILKINR